MAKKQTKYFHLSFYRTKGGRWEIAYTLNGKRRVDRLGYYEAHARQRAAEVDLHLDKLKSGLVSADEASRLVKDRSPVTKHVDAWDAHLKAYGRDENYRKTVTHRVRHTCEMLGAKSLPHLTPAALGKVPALLREKQTRSKEAYSAQTIRHYQRAMSQFLNWCLTNGLVTTNAQRKVASVKVAGKVTHQRRPPSLEELKILFAWLKGRKAYRTDEITGDDRAMLYRLLYVTGLRVGELSPLQVESLRLTVTPPTVEVPAELTKNGKGASQPLPTWIVEVIQEWLGDRRTGPLFPRMPGQPGKCFERDLERARADWIAEAEKDPEELKRRSESEVLKRETASGHLDLHSLRHGYVTALVTSGVNVKDAQALARHSSAELTVGRYSHQTSDLARHVESSIGKV